jgi:hypothetical protein
MAMASAAFSACQLPDQRGEGQRHLAQTVAIVKLAFIHGGIPSFAARQEFGMTMSPGLLGNRVHHVLVISLA